MNPRVQTVFTGLREGARVCSLLAMCTIWGAEGLLKGVYGSVGYRHLYKSMWWERN